jgi:hypothetical protein
VDIERALCTLIGSSVATDLQITRGTLVDIAGPLDCLYGDAVSVEVALTSS